MPDSSFVCTSFLGGGQRLIIITARKVDLRATQMGAQMHWIQTEDVLHVIQR